MNNVSLRKWADKVERQLPSHCPKCGSELREIRYAKDCDRIIVRLTGAVIDFVYYVAECPSCGAELLRRGAREAEAEMEEGEEHGA